MSVGGYVLATVLGVVVLAIPAATVIAVALRVLRWGIS